MSTIKITTISANDATTVNKTTIDCAVPRNVIDVDAFREELQYAFYMFEELKFVNIKNGKDVEIDVYEKADTALKAVRNEMATMDVKPCTLTLLWAGILNSAKVSDLSDTIDFKGVASLARKYFSGDCEDTNKVRKNIATMLTPLFKSDPEVFSVRDVKFTEDMMTDIQIAVDGKGHTLRGTRSTIDYDKVPDEFILKQLVLQELRARFNFADNASNKGSRRQTINITA